MLAHFRFPWVETDKSKKTSPEQPRETELKSSPSRKTQGTKGTGATGDPSQPRSAIPWKPKPGDQPGLLVFRKDQTLLAVFLVLETPTRGLRKHQFDWSLDLLDAFADLGEPNVRDAVPRSFRILGPRYTGTQTSLNHAIDGWLTSSPSDRIRGAQGVRPLFRRSHRFSIVAAATEIKAETLKKLNSVDSLTDLELLCPIDVSPVPAPQSIVFRSAMNRRRDVTIQLMEFLRKEVGGQRIALLLESNTVLGKRLERKDDKAAGDDHPPDVYHYPLHIASLRASYEKQGLLGDPGGQVFHSAGRLELSPEEGERRRDVVAPATPEFSTRVDELVMVQTMTEIARLISSKYYNSVGIAGSSSLDVIFLAQLIRKYSPDAVIFTNLTDLLFTQPQTIADLRGMLVGSSYPLYAPNRLWSYPYGDGPDVFFNQESVQAIYNATMCLLVEIFDDDDKLKYAALPLEFSQPFHLQADSPRPPIWIGVVGNRGIYPLRVVDAVSPLADGNRDPWPPLQASISGVPATFHPSYQPFWMILEGLLFLIGAGMLALAMLELWWALARINRWDLSGWLVWKILKRLAFFLVWSRARNSGRAEPNRDAPHSSSGHGPGVLLILAHVAFLLVYVTVNRPFLFPFVDSLTQIKRDWWLVLARLGFWVALASLSITAFSWFLLAVEKRDPESSPDDGYCHRHDRRGVLVDSETRL